MNMDQSLRQTSDTEGSSETDKKRDDHLIDLCDGWSLWRTACLRGAGFPVEGLNSLVAADADAELERLHTEQQSRDAAFLAARDICWTRIRSHQGEARRPWRRVLRRLDKGAIPSDIPADAELETAIALLTGVVAAVERARLAYAEAFECDAMNASQALRVAAAEPRMREAVTWQNRQAVKTGFDHLLRQPLGRRDSQTRQHALLVARYLQRYCATNESIGFFGPIGWAVFVENGPSIDLRPGPSLLGARFIHFEYWVIDALIDTMLRDPEFRMELPPRLAPSMRIEGKILHGPLGRRSEIKSGQLALLQILDGKSNVKVMAKCLDTDPESLLVLLERLAHTGVIVWRPPIPVDEYPERALQACLDGISNANLRQRLSTPLQRLVTARENVAQAAGDAEALDAAMANLDTEFQAMTDQAPRRQSGKAYAGRTLVYEDCRRDVKLSLGPDLLARLGPPLTLILHSARWFSWQFAQQYLEFVSATLYDCQQESGRAVVALDHLWYRLQAQTETVHFIVDDVVEQLQQRWAPILVAGSEEAGSIQLSAAAIRDQVHEVFAATQPGWPGARYHSPDVLIAADSVEAISAGRYLLVLGEVHTGGNSLAQNALLNMHPQPQDLLSALELDTPDPELIPLYPHRRPGQRMVYDPHIGNSFHMAHDDSSSWRPPDKVLPISALVVEDSSDGLVVRSRDQSRCFPAIAFFGPQMTGLCVNRFGIDIPRPHSPRVSIDQLVINRESWRFAFADLDFVSIRSAADRYAAARRWARDHDLPRWLFVRVPGEKKPTYVDFKSPVSVDLLVKFVRGAARQADAELSVSEMLPTPDQTWLTDAEGQRYTSEIRFVVQDPAQWRP